METRVCEDVHTEFILSSCYSSPPPPLPSPPSGSLNDGAFRGCVPHTDYTTGAGLAQEFSSSCSFTQASLLIQRRDGESSVRHREQQIIVRYVRHRERISNSSSSESKNRSNLSESEKSAKENLKEKFKLMFINSVS